jgi:predicted RNA-binding protein
VNQDIAEPNDRSHAWDVLGDRRVVASQTVERLAHDLELAIDR